MDSKASPLRQRTTEYALRVVPLLRALPNCSESRVIGQQLLRSVTSVAANYRAACKAGSRPDFIFKLGFVEQEADEAVFWAGVSCASGIGEDGPTHGSDCASKTMDGDLGCVAKNSKEKQSAGGNWQSKN